MNKCIRLLLILFLVVSAYWTTTSKVYAVDNFQVSYSMDKTELKNSENFKVSVTVSNIGPDPILNFEVRVPFYNFIADTQVVTVNPSFNKLLNSNEYPVGFNSRSWVINNFAAGETKTFSVEYKVIDDPKVANGLASVFTLPGTWADPRGLEANKAQKLNYFRSDIYVNSIYKGSYEYPLPKLTLLDNELSTVNLPAKYTFSGSKTKPLKNINSTNIKSFSNFILETSDVLLEWQMPIDFSGSDVPSKMAKLDEYLKVEWGKVDAPEKDLDFLNKPVKVTFKNTNFVSEPRIKIKSSDVDLKTAKAVWTKGSDKVSLNLDSLSDVSLYPNLSLDQTVVETSESFITIKGTTSDPSSSVSYKIDEQALKDVFGIDLQTGEFEVRIDDIKDAKQVEFSSKLRNGEINEKIVLVKSDNSLVTPTVQTTEKPKTVSQIVNPITLALFLSALALLSIIAGFVYYLLHRKRTQKNSLNELKIRDNTADKNGSDSLEKVYSLKDLSSGKQELPLKKEDEEELGFEKKEHLSPNDDKTKKDLDSFLKDE